MDFTKLRAAALKDENDEEAVTVNTRALIDKVLARYSGEWTTLRELIQNAADAQASTVTIKFDTIPSVHIPIPNSTNASEILKHTLQNHTLRRLIVTNDGQKFGVNDWCRLKRIAEGNPDETKIGAFGVGFYSVFSDCEDPFVSSGSEAMAFYWKGNSLFTKKVQLSPEQGNPNTSFVLDYRNSTTPMPNLLSLAQFLATSLTFVSLQKIELWIDDWKIISLQKKLAPGMEIPILGDVETRTKGGTMKIQTLERENVQMDAKFMNVVGWKPSFSSVSKSGSHETQYGGITNDIPSIKSFFSRLTSSSTQSQLKCKVMRDEKELQDIVLEDLTALTTANVFLRVTTAVIKTYISASFAAELERATKKPPPKSTKMAILTSSFDEKEASSKTNLIASSVDIFSSVLPGRKPGGRVFIGFPTHQTTGAGIHLSAPSVIPTVERESIDLNARWVRSWNEEMLRVSGIIARLAFSSEMSDLSSKIKYDSQIAGHGNKITKSKINTFMREALHILETFTFGESTPSSKVSQIIEEAFWTAYRQPSIEVYSTRGVLMTPQVRLAIEDLSGFVEGIPVVPAELMEQPLIKKLKIFGLLTDITISDVKHELEVKALDRIQLMKFISWIGPKAISGEIDGPTIHSLLDVAVAMTDDEEGSGVIALGGIKYYLNANIIPADVPVPDTTIPFECTKETPTNQLHALGWDQLEILPWLRYLIETNNRRPSEQNLNFSVNFAAQILHILSKSWESMNEVSKAAVFALLQPISIIPTRFGMKRPTDAFLPSVKLFEDLPTITSCPGVKEKFLAAIGVRKTVDLDTIFNRLLSPTLENQQVKKGSKSRHIEVIKYLASVKDDIPAEDFKKLKYLPFCPAEADLPGYESTKGNKKLFRIAELFEPKDAIRDLRLPVIQWPGPPGSYRPRSTEGRFLSSLGLRIYPSVPEVIDFMASEDLVLSEKAMTYFIANHHTNGYASFQVGSTNKKFLPLENGDERVSPTNCYTNENCSILGFKILKKELVPHANKFGVVTDPPMNLCIERLINSPPKDTRHATELFRYFSERLGEIGPIHISRLEEASIIPVKKIEISDQIPGNNTENQQSYRLFTPKQCYLGTSSTYGEILDFVDFGHSANSFLLRCGSKNEPTTVELANLACKEPARMLGVMKSPEKYLSLLRTLADELPQLKRDKVLHKKMRQSKWLLASFEITMSKDKSKSQICNQGDDSFDSDPEDNEETKIKEYQLARPDQIVINDNYTSYRLFKQSLISAPEEEKLEDFYLALGAQTLNSLVQEDLRLGQPCEKQASAVKLRAHILERSKLFLYEHKRESIRHDVKWLEKNLSVQVVSSIALRRSLKGHILSHTEKRSAACTNDSRNGWTLYVTSGENDSYQISQSLCRILLERPNHSSYLTFESFLSLNLYQLRSRGYNVERILRAKAAEQRIAEEERKKQLEAEQKLIREQEDHWNKENQILSAVTQKDRSKSVENQIPGAFENSSPENSPLATQKKIRSGLFSGLSKRLGLNNLTSDEAQEQMTNFLGGMSQNQNKSIDPPSYEEANKGKVYSPAALQQNLLNAIQSSRAHDSNALFTPPSTQTINEQTSYCDSKPAQDIYFLADARNGTRIFVSKTITTNTARELLSTNVTALNSFAGLLHEVADIYSLPRKAMHIFIDETGGTIAFNANGSIFGNFRFFKQLHFNRINEAEGKVIATSYWWVVAAHELAHNVVAAHNAEHSFYTESLIGNYFSKMMTKAIGYQQLNIPASSNIQEKDTKMLE